MLIAGFLMRLLIIVNLLRHIWLEEDGTNIRFNKVNFMYM